MKLVPLEGAATVRMTKNVIDPIKIFRKFGLYSLNESGEPFYDGYQIWVHLNIPDYTDLTKNVIDIRYPIKNYPI